MNGFNEHKVRRRLERAKKKLSSLIDREIRLSMKSRWEMGYLQGRISVLEDWLDEITEMNQEVETS